MSEPPSDSAEVFDPVAFAEHWYHHIWPEKYPVEFQRYVQALKTLGQWEDE
ncbi:hypothetical protein SEA_KARDASHIAN_59 [Streptomyces phage Kardashian]|nr:hypothetical protein SEA_KARDASHIAN_59 [Streptomyces phage Kardashian]